MKITKKGLSILISIITALCCLPVFSVFSDAAGHHTGEIIEFGSYPQSQVTDEALIAELDAAGADAAWLPMWYSSDPANEAYFYKDVTAGDAKYRAIRFTRTHSGAQSRYGYVTNTVYWFRFDPVSWTVLDPESGLLIANAILDTQPYNRTVYAAQYADEAHLYYLNNYAHSTVRSWLNGAFSDAAFSAEEADILVRREQDNSMPGMEESYTQYACENTDDLVFLPSYEEMGNEEWFADDASRIRGGTAYARALGLENYYNQSQEGSEESDYWFLRSPDQVSTKQGYIGVDGLMYSGIDCYSFDVGVCPAVYIDLAAYDRLNGSDIPTPSAYDSLTFTFENGILFVSGAGEIPTADAADPAPFLSYAQDCNVIMIGEGIDAVAANAFTGLTQAKMLILNGETALQPEAFASNTAIETVICAASVQIGADTFAAETEICFFEPKAHPHTGSAANNVNVIPYTYADGTLTFDGRARMSIYDLLDLMAVMCGYYEPIRFVGFSSYTSLDVPFYVYNTTRQAYVPAENDTLEGVRFSVKLPTETDWETITFNEFCALADTQDLSRFRLVADIETGDPVQDNDFEIRDENPVLVVIKRVLKWITGLLNKLFSIFSKLR